MGGTFCRERDWGNTAIREREIGEKCAEREIWDHCAGRMFGRKMCLEGDW